MFSWHSKSDPRVSLSECSRGLGLLLIVLDETVIILFSFLTEMWFFKDSLLIGSLSKDLLSPVPLLFEFTGESGSERRSFPECFSEESLLEYSLVVLPFSEDLLCLEDTTSSLWLPLPEMPSAEGEAVLAGSPAADPSCRSGLALEATSAAGVERGTWKVSRGKGILASLLIFWNYKENKASVNKASH